MHDSPPSTAPGSYVATSGHSNTQAHDDFAWMDQSLQTLPAHQPTHNVQSSSDQATDSVTTLPSQTFESEESISRQLLPMDPSQVSRGLPRRRSRYLIQNFDQRSNAIFVPPVGHPADPLERWKESPPEGEAASLSAIQNALEDSAMYPSRVLSPGMPDSRAGNSFQSYRRSGSRATSTTSGESATSASSQRSNRSVFSALSSGAGVKKKQTGAGRQKRSSANNARIFCCTFCCDKFKSKFDWMRHEKTLHLNLETWACAPFGGSVVWETTGRAHCAYCNQLDPSLEHLEQHNYGPCQEKTRTFRRKDHLMQHLRLFHRLETTPIVNDWKLVKTDFPPRCGFCDTRISNWEERADHLTMHFRDGCTMANWAGDHDFPPDITAQITHSVPPYMLDFESRTFIPFSATSRDANDHLSQMLSRAAYVSAAGETDPLTETPEMEMPPVQEPQLESYTEVLTRHLSHYARRMMSSGIIPTDEMFQLEARQLLFDSEDQWNQTMADNHEWLTKFREEHSTNDALRPPE
ncbi:unnamed protein product [Penicillium salamii]|uniref:C2H2-type domain-containing protein n=1 Tax=Penicillium salamii TaxID=1612424 RepID=A0A9W4IBM3_9EURO|nr:unnamed protein product [Penicillium salamii]CAG8251600.1 unnamed protein product [Penicillium salamii]CAG8266479.1 unnamed protein product [Penicillium salamii]CAG8341159.1 unnamed protein product [Penicillium salamii]CAG8376959.1 unnamed protein product [Penicillium salamii]